MTAHPSSEQLLAWLDGELPFLRRTLVDRHIRACPQCRRQVASLESTIGSLRQLMLDQDRPARLQVDRARWRFRQAVAAEKASRASSRRRLPLWLAAAASLLVVSALAVRFYPTPARPPQPALASLVQAETAGFSSSVREERFELTLSSPSAPPVSRRFRLWSAPARRSFALRASDLDGSLRFAAFTAENDPKPSTAPGALFAAVSASSNLAQLETAFWQWLRNQLWEPVSLAREAATFANSTGATLTVNQNGGSTLWRITQPGALHSTLSLELGSDRLPRSIEIAWGDGPARRTLRVTRLERIEYSSYHAAAPFFRPDPTPAPAIRQLPRPSPSLADSIPAEPPTPAALRAAEVQALSVLHRLRLCSTDEVHVRLTPHSIEVAALLPSTDRAAQLRLLLEDLPAHRLIALRLLSSPPPPALTPARSPHNEETVTSSPAPGEKWLATRVPGSRLTLLDSMNRLVQGALALSSDGWALRHLADRFPAAAEADLPPAERRLLQAMLHDHSLALQQHCTTLRRLLGQPPASTPEPPLDPSLPWQPAALELQSLAESSSAALLRLFASSGSTSSPSATGFELDLTSQRLTLASSAALRLQREALAASVR